MILLTAALAAPPDLALATEVTGAVTFHTADAAPAALQAFAKVREGDVLTLPEHTSIDLTYFADGRTERFTGPLQLVVGSKTSPAASIAGKALVGEALAELPALIARQELSKGGHTLVRGAPTAEVPLDDDERAELEAARVRYVTLREGRADTDVLPEIYLGAVYLAYGQEAPARTILEQARTRCPTCAGPTRLLATLPGG